MVTPFSSSCHNAVRSAPGTHCLEVNDLHAHYGRVCALRDVSFQTYCGRTIALVGPNGAGKTTLLKAMVGLIPNTTGSVLWCGASMHRRTHEIAYLPQREKIDWTFPLTVQGLVDMGRYPLLGWWRRMQQEDVEQVEQAMTAMRITEFRHRQIGALSGGQQQRVFIARALAQEPHVLLLDEPFSGLDDPSSTVLARLLKNLAEQGTLVIASHHDLRSVADIFDEVLLLNRRVVAFGDPAETLSEEHLEEAFGV